MYAMVLFSTIEARSLVWQCNRAQQCLGPKHMGHILAKKKGDGPTRSKEMGLLTSEMMTHTNRSQN